MTTFSQTMSGDRISEEVYGDIVTYLSNGIDTLSELGFDILSDDSFPLMPSVSGTCDLNSLTASISADMDIGELDLYIDSCDSQRLSSECDSNRALMNSLPLQMGTEPEKTILPTVSSIPLSQSVGVGLPQKSSSISHKLSIKNELEETYRARYKSDYFTQNGTNRKPRYIADRCGNHYVTLQMAPGSKGVIRADWLTVPTKTGDLYVMPYRFQQDNTSPDVPDCNPIHISVQADRLGVVKLYLVLIKSKQDELKNIQSLKPFHPYRDAFGLPDKKYLESKGPTNPKSLIQKYQLDKSQLAFTFCTVSSDGKSCIPEWDTTVYSTILSEVSSEGVKNRTAVCPNCMHSFPLPNANEDDDNGQEKIIKKRKLDSSIAGESPRKLKMLV